MRSRRIVVNVVAMAAGASLCMHAPALGVGAAGQDPPTPAWRRHAAPLYLASRRMRELSGERIDRVHGLTNPFDGLTAAEVTARVAPEREALERDLRADVSSAHPLSPTLEALGELRAAAMPSVPTIIELIDRFPPPSGSHIPSVCASMKTLGQIAPAAPDVIAAAAHVIAGGLPARGVCHPCGCALELLTKAGPAARPIAGPVLQRAMADPRFITPYDFQLGRALTAMGLSAADDTAQGIARVLDARVLPGNRAEVLRALGAHAAATPSDRPAIREAATRLLSDDLPNLRIAAAEALGATGAEAVPALMRALGDWHYRVRAAAASSLARIGPASRPASPLLAEALDPFLGTAAAAGSALMAIGPSVLPIVEARYAALPSGDRARPALAAVILTLRDGRDRLTGVLAHELTHGPGDAGFVAIEPVQTTTRGTAYVPGTHRIRVRYAVLRYGGPTKMPVETRETTVTAWQSANNGLASLAGRRAGDRLRLLLSPEIAQPLAYGTSLHRDAYRTHVSGTSAYYDVWIERVCEPQIWKLLSAGGIFGEWKIETSCRD